MTFGVGLLGDGLLDISVLVGSSMAPDVLGIPEGVAVLGIPLVPPVVRSTKSPIGLVGSG